MSFQKYDFVGVSTTQLPYVHASFPASQKLGTIRYNTMRSMHRGKDATRKNAIGLREGALSMNDVKEPLDLKLPQLDLNHQGFDKKTTSPRINGGNICRQKAYFRLKGIPIRRMYTLNRTKTDKYEDPEENKLSTENKKKSISLSFLDLKEAEPKTSNDSNADESEYSLLDNCDSPWSRVRLRELDSESPIPGFRSRRVKNGRKLGNIVSSRRLQQLLDNEDTLDPYSFYMY